MVYLHTCIIKSVTVSSVSKTIANTTKYQLLLLKYIIFKNRSLAVGAVWGKKKKKKEIGYVAVILQKKYIVVVTVSYNIVYKH